MNIAPHTTLLCPHCYRDFRVAAWRVNQGSSVSCTNCDAVICFDANLPEHRSAIEGAKRATDTFHTRQSLFPQPRPAERQKVLDHLDHLSRQLDALSRR
jgi:hypothetical protein